MQLVKKVTLPCMLLLIIFLTGCLEIPLSSTKTSDKSVALTNNKILEQEVYISDRNFSQLRILINNNYEEINKFKLTLKVFAKNKTKPLRSLTIEKPIRHRRFIKFSFKPIKDSKQKSYTIRLNSYNTKNEPLLIAYNEKGPPLKLSGETKSNTSLIAIPVVTAEPRMLIGSILGRILKDKIFLVLYLFAIFFISSLLIFKIRFNKDGNA